MTKPTKRRIHSETNGNGAAETAAHDNGNGATATGVDLTPWIKASEAMFNGMMTLGQEMGENGISEANSNIIYEAMSKVEEEAKKLFNIRNFSEKLKSLFIQANTQFHLLFLSPDRSDVHANASSVLPFTKSEEIYSNWDKVLREISKNTGDSCWTVTAWWRLWTRSPHLRISITISPTPPGATGQGNGKSKSASTSRE